MLISDNFYISLSSSISMKSLNPNPAGGMEVPGNPLTFFGDNSNNIGLRLFKFFDFSN